MTEIVGNSTLLKDILSICERVAITDTPVLILGESGTGKELIATYIKEKSLRKDKPFISINCAALPDTLLENELFGHKKGAFTDARNDYIGKLGLANGGTLFLDEVGDLSLAIQAKLLRVLQFKTYEQLGSSESIYTDIRIIAATNRDLLSLMREKKFREDLYYRLNVVPIKIPPLRERREDIGDLVNFFIKKYCIKNKKEIKSITDSALLKLKSYDWPGNVRELENTIERAVVLSTGLVLDENDFNIEISNFNKKFELKSLKEAITDFKREYIIKALEMNNYNQTKTAKALDIERTYLVRLIKELNISKI
ncbi:MAG TPA: sigma-54 dependent transcriptional regulator [Spirochaetota bacterium]|nr:sigma-54 dependent transcriptional regulator [Spirochaetota bacterium]HOL56756.1 sigma-54 dependent transcriptional regulator [Spirochaetota bacterium]HPP04188.1 sigma-54 dependent transcriptional regulator [Spirochaetota bacterium]